jgi:type VI secretion system secreted protein VgrG
MGSTEQESYHGYFEFQPSDRPFRAPIVTPKPRIYGIQTAKVVTKDEGGTEEIDVEKLTEVYVWFYWDRKKHQQPKRSCKIRVAQCWSGKKWGGQFIPRVGMEVVVEFLEGDPDRPLIVGTVYNDEYKPPYDLPSKKNIAGIYSDSTKGGGGYNEFHLDDTKMSEKIRMHAEKDHEVVIRHAETTEIGEVFEIPKGSPSRDTTIKMGDDKLEISTGDQNVSIPLGSQKTDAMIQIMDSVIASSVTITPGAITVTAPIINLTAMATINLNAPIINITGIVNINGALNVNGPVLISGMVPVTVPA